MVDEAGNCKKTENAESRNTVNPCHHYLHFQTFLNEDMLTQK
jgi:hypothetical protein